MCNGLDQVWVSIKVQILALYSLCNQYLWTVQDTAVGCTVDVVKYTLVYCTARGQY